MTVFENIHWLDATIVGVVGIGVIAGAFTGLWRMVIQVVICLASLYGAFLYQERAATALRSRLSQPAPNALLEVLAFVGMIVAVYVTLAAGRRGCLLAVSKTCPGGAATRPRPAPVARSSLATWP